jgi:Holliday junction DNA helicase RuvB
MSERVFDPGLRSETAAAVPAAEGLEREFESTLRPLSLDEFVGQERLLSNLRVAIAAARSRGEALEHVLFSGPPGLGKTSLGRILAREMGTRLFGTSARAIWSGS